MLNIQKSGLVALSALVVLFLSIDCLDAAEVPKGLLTEDGNTFAVSPVEEPKSQPERKFKVVQTRVLTDAKDLSDWTTGDGKPNPNWEIKDGVIRRINGAADLFLKGNYQNFILEFEFMIGQKGNSGVYYYAWPEKLKANGYEYQIIDDVRRKINPGYERFATGGLYAMYHRKYDSGPRIRDGYNQGRILVMGNHIEHWLNGKLAISIQTGTENWFEHVASSRMNKNPKFGRATTGQIAFQNHGSDVSYRNVKIIVFEENVK